MSTMYLEMGVFTISLVFIMFMKSHEERHNYRDCALFCRLLLATMGILFVDTIGWVIDGKPLFGQIWITTVIDGLDLILTTTVCWCWVQYALYISNAKKQMLRKWYKDFATYLLILQIGLVCASQIFGFYYYIDASGAYHRGDGYIIHTLLSMILLAYSSGNCVRSLLHEHDKEKRREMFFVAFIILIPIAGNVFQLYVYGYPTVWLCMVFMVLAVYIHIQDKRMNQEREEQNAILKRALVQAEAANAAKTQFLARMSHDMRTPMNGILGLSYLMEDEDDLEKIKMQIPKLRDSGEYLLQLINDVLDVNRVESGKVEIHPRECEEKEVIQSILSMVQPLSEKKNIRLHFETVHMEWTSVMLDVERVKQIFINLITNAIKFTPEGGQVDFTMELLSKDKDIIRHKFVVRDNGIGMSEEFLPKVFNPFSQEERIHENLGGTGLGLSIVKSLIELMGGNIEVESTLNQGTEFTVFLDFPMVHHTISKASEKTEAIEEKNLEGQNILLCEDHALNAEIITKLLEKKGISVTWRENGKQGVEAYAQSEPGEYDCILMDIRMPVMDGLEATEKIRAMKRADAKTIPVIAMTANAYTEDVDKSMAVGMNAHLSKPIEPQKIFDTLYKYVTSKS